MNRNTLKCLVISAILAGCSPIPVASSTSQRSLRTTEALADFDQAVSQFRTYYGPLEYKNDRFGFDFEAMAAGFRERIVAATSDADVYAAIAELAFKMRDGHVSFNLQAEDALSSTFMVPLFAFPVADKVLIGNVDGSLSGLGIQIGDEIVTIDGKDAWSYLPTITKYAAFGNELSDRHLIYHVFNRPAWMKDLLPARDQLEMTLRRSSGEEYHVELVWRVTAQPTATVFATDLDAQFTVSGVDSFNAAAKGSLMAMGAAKSYFFTPAVAAAFDMVEVQPSAAYLAKYGLTAETAQPVFALLYRIGNKTVLLVRQPTYTVPKPDATIATYKAVLDQYDGVADVLVIDQTHNPGGSLTYANDFVTLFAKGQARAMVQRMNADRKWVQDLRGFAKEVDPTLASEFSRALLERAKIVEVAYDAGETLTAPIPFLSLSHLDAAADYTWKKPVLMLTDELAGSCGDIVPMLMQRNGLATLFGERTMGLGGNVEAVPELTNTRSYIKLTRGLFTTFEPSGEYRLEDFVENNGVHPDLPYKLSLDDVRQGYVPYVAAFSAAAAAL